MFTIILPTLRWSAFIGLIATLLTPKTGSAQGSLIPTGPPGPTQKSLQEIWDELVSVKQQNQTLLGKVSALERQTSAQQQMGAVQLLALGAKLPWLLSVADPGPAGNGLGPGARSRLKFDAALRPNVVHVDDGTGELKLSIQTNGVWNHRVLATGSTGVQHGFTFDSNDQPLVAFKNASGVQLARVESAAVALSAIPNTLTASSLSLALNSNKQPSVAFHDAGLKFAVLSGGNWTTTTLDPGAGVGIQPSLAYGPRGQAMIAYGETVSFSLKFAFNDGGPWTRSVIDPVAFVDSTSMAVGPDGLPWVAYVDDLSNHLKAAKFNGSTWDLHVVDNSGQVLNDCALAFGPEGLPSISYSVNINAGRLKYARFDGMSWANEAVDISPSVGVYSSLDFGPDGQPMIAYQDSANRDLKVARRGAFMASQ